MVSQNTTQVFAAAELLRGKIALLVTRFSLRADAVLRGRAWPVAGAGPVRGAFSLLLMSVGLGAFYGAVMGTYDHRALQLLYSAVKVPMLLAVTFAISLPSFFVFNTLFGLREGFLRAIGALLSTQAALTLVLAAFAPLTAFWYASSEDHGLAILFNAAMFGTASFSAQLLLRRLYAPLIARNRRHVLMLRTWLITYAFVGIQMGWVLRPFVGDRVSSVEFVRSGAWGNAYVYVAQLIWNALRRQG